MDLVTYSENSEKGRPRKEGRAPRIPGSGQSYQLLVVFLYDFVWGKRLGCAAARAASLERPKQAKVGLETGVQLVANGAIEAGEHRPIG